MASRARAARRRRPERPGDVGGGPGDRRRARAADDQRQADQRPSARAGQDARRDGGHRRHPDRLPGGHGAVARLARALRLRRRLRPACGRGFQRRPGARRRRAAEGRRVAPARARRVHPRLPRRGHARRSQAAPAQRARGAARAQRHVHGVAQALPGRRALPARHPQGRGALRGRRRAQALGEGRRALDQRRAARQVPRRSRPKEFDAKTPRGPTTFATTRTSTGCAARSAPTCAAPTRATRSGPSRAGRQGHRLRGPPELPPPHDPARDALRPGAAGGRRRPTTASTAASSSCASRRASRASSRACRCSG